MRQKNNREVNVVRKIEGGFRGGVQASSLFLAPRTTGEGMEQSR